MYSSSRDQAKTGCSVHMDSSICFNFKHLSCFCVLITCEVEVKYFSAP